MLSTYHAKFLFQNSNGKSSYFDLASWFWPIQKFLLHSKMTERIKNELALVNQRGSDVIFALHQNIVANLYANLREVRPLRRSFLVFTTSKMPTRCCVVQYCSRVSDKELEEFQCILLRQAVTSVRSGKDLFLNTEKTSTLPVRLGYACCISKLIVLPVQFMQREPKDE